MWNTREWITDPSLLSTVFVKVSCRKQVIIGTYHSLLAATSAEIRGSRGEETALAATAVAAVTGKSQSKCYTPQFQALTYPTNSIVLRSCYTDDVDQTKSSLLLQISLIERHEH